MFFWNSLAFSMLAIWSLPTRDQTHLPCFGRQSLNHWTTRDPLLCLFWSFGNLFSLGFPDGSVGKDSACNAEESSSIPGSQRSPGEGIGYPLQYSWASLVAHMVKNRLQCKGPGFSPWVGKMPWRRAWNPVQYSCLENPMDRAAWQAYSP